MAEVYHLSILPQAIADLEEIENYISLDSPQNASEVTKAIADAMDSLHALPFRFKQIGFSRKYKCTIHVMTVGSYLVKYRIKPEPATVFILTIRRAARRR